MAQILGLLFLILFSSTAAYANDWDLEYWQYFRWKDWEKEGLQIYTAGETRLFKDLTKYYYSRLSANVSYRTLFCLDLEAHYSLINVKPHGTTANAPFIFIQRYELELNPFMELPNGVTIKWRNRMEFLKRETLNHYQHIFRHKTNLIIPIHNKGPWIAIKISDEIFYDFDLKKFTQNRLIPLEFTFELNKNVFFSLFFQVRNFYSLGTDKWFRSFVFGSELQF